MPAATTQPTKARLVVLVVVDQLRRDQLYERSYAGGFARLKRDGLVFQDATLGHAVSSTCPGHTVLVTGVHPGRSGIIDNDAIDRSTWETVYCVADAPARAAVLGPGAEQQLVGRSPARLRASALGDWLKEHSPASRVYSVAGKDRAAVTLGGRRADGAYWPTVAARGFTSSAYYHAAQPDWLVAANGDLEQRTGLWANIPDSWEHDAGSSRPDDYFAESDSFERESGHPLGRGDDDDVLDQVENSPWLDRQTMDVALRLLRGQQLGQDDAIDFLGIGLSATDKVGHRYGPFSAEADDTLQRVDGQIGRLLHELDEYVGPGQYLVVLSSDHGVLPLPEWLQEQGDTTCPIDGGRRSVISLAVGLYWDTYRRDLLPFGNPGALVKIAGSQISINRTYAAEHDVDVPGLLRHIEARLEADPAIAEVWTQAEIQSRTTAIAALYRASFNPELSGDLHLQLTKQCLISTSSGTNHGTPYLYDRAVPLVVFGADVGSGAVAEPVHTVDVAPSLAHWLQIQAPSGLDGRVLALPKAVADDGRAATPTATATGRLTPERAAQ